MHSIKVNFGSPFRVLASSGIIAYQNHIRGLVANGDQFLVGL
jgi:hypothetical protein